MSKKRALTNWPVVFDFGEIPIWRYKDNGFNRRRLAPGSPTSRPTKKANSEALRSIRLKAIGAPALMHTVLRRVFTAAAIDHFSLHPGKIGSTHLRLRDCLGKDGSRQRHRQERYSNR